MAKCKGSLCIILQELPLSVKTTASTAAHFDARGETIGIISDAGFVSLLKVGTEEVCTDILDGLAISQFVWDSAVLDSKLQTSMQMFAVITKDSQVQLHCLQEEGQSFVQEKIAGCSFEVVTTALGTFVGTDFSSPVDLRVLSLQGSLLTVLIDTTVCRLALSDDGAVEILQSYNIGIPVQEISQTRVIQGMLVVLQNVGIISFHSLDKKEKVAVVCIQEYISQRHSTSSSHEDIGTEFKHFAISEDLINLVVCDSRENLIPIDLNAYFHHNQQNLLRKNRRDRVGVPGEAGQCEGDGPSYLEKRNRYRNISTDNNRKWVNQLDHMRMRSTHRFSCSGVLSGRRGVGVPTIHHRTNKRSQNWYENAEGVRMTTKWVRTCNDDSAKTFSDDKVVHGFMRRNRRMSRQSQDVQCSQLTVPDTSVTLPSSVDKEAMTVSRLYISGASVSAWYTARPGTETHEVQSAVCMFDLCSGQQELCEFREPACVAFSPINTHPHLIVMESAIATVMFNEEQEAFVNKLMMYDSATVADSVCRVNRWDRCSIPIHALEVGLRHRQLDTVAFFLKSRETGAAASSPFRSQMDIFQLESAVELLIATIKDNINGDMQSKLFGEQLLHMTLEFVNHLMRNATSQAQVQEEETGSVDDDLKNSINKVIKYLSELRKYQKDVPEQSGQKVTSEQDVQVEKSEDFQYYMPEKSNFTDRRLESWKHMTRQEIIQDGILNSCIPLVQAHLHRHDKTTVRSQPSRLKDILDAGLSEVYQFLLQRNLRTSAKMLNNMGFDVTDQLRRLCLYTSNRTLRDFLIEELEKSKQLTEEELKMVEFVQKLERLYTCRSYERAKEMAEETRKSYWENTHRLSRTPTMQAKSILSSLIKTGDLEPSDPMNYDSDGYSHVILEWVRTWDEETKQRILLDRVIHSNDSSLLATFDPKTRWLYLLSHNLWDKICQWINEDSSEITAEMLNDMSHCTTYVKNKVLDEMARRGLFSSEELASFEKLLHRLSRSGSLMVKPHTLSKSTVMNVDDFNTKFIGFCLQHCLPNVLYFYLDFFRIAVTSEETQQLLSAHGDIPWFAMLLFFREVGMKYKDPTAMFRASLANSRLLQNSPRTVSALLEANRPLAAMATLVYAPGTLNEVTLPVENEKDRLWKVNPELLQKSLLAYPKLQSALFQVQTADGVVAQDITMYQLLKGNSPFDPSRLFRWQSTNNMSTQNNGGEDFEIPHFARSDLVSKYGHKEVLRYTYYLRRGRPSFAFITFVKSLGDSDASQIKKRMKQAYWKAYMVALTNFTNSAICAACTTFSEMLGHDSLAIRVDIQSGNLIYSHQKKMADKITDKKTKQQIVKDAEEDIVSDFTSLLRHRRNCAEKILAELENAIVESIKNSDEESTSLETSQQWSLAVLFCHLHKLPYTSVYLRECAEDNQWLRFLCFAQNYQYPQKQVLELVRNFQDANIREHLQHAVEHLQYTSHEGQQQQRESEEARRSRDLRAQYLKRVGIGKSDLVSSSTDSDKEVDGQTKGEDSPVTSSDTGTDIPPADLKPVNIPDDLFSIIFECEGKSQPWRALLACCVSLKRPILAVLAACYKEASVLHCLCVWLLTCMDEAHVALVTQDMTTVQWHRWSLDDLSIILDVAMENKYYSLVVKAFSVFDPNCALMGFLNFVEAFLAFHDADLCKLHLRKFQDALLQCRRSRNDIQLAQIGHQMWYEETAHKLTNILLQKCTTRYDMNMLLSAVTERNVTRLYTETDYVKLYTVFKLLEDEDIDLRMECFINPSEDANKQYYQNIIDTLQEKAKFNLAREFADIMDLPTNQITFNKLLCELSAIQESKVWQRPGGRETFWLKCHQTFKQHQTSPKVAANFFEIQAARQSSIVQQVYVREREQLLGLAHHWLSKEQPLIQREDLEKLEQQIWRCRIKVEVESSERSPDTDEAMQLDKMFQLPDSEKVEPDFGHLGNEELLIRETYIIKRNTPSLLTDPKESKALDKLIQRELENYCISQALKLAKQFQYYNQDLAIVMTCLQLAQGTLNVHEIDPLMKELPKKGRDRRTSWSWMSGGLSRSTSFASLSSFQSDTFTQDVEDVIETMETITEHCTLGKTCCLRILNCYTIGQVLNKSYESIVKHGRFDVLREVLTSEHAHRFPLAKTYIQSSGITDDELAGFLSDAITHSLSIFTGYEDDDAPDSGGELIFSPIQNRENFINLVKLCDNPAVLGNRLLDTAASFASSNTEESNQAFAVEIELLVRGHQCHTLCYNMEGIASVLRTCRTRSMVLAAAEEYSLLVRLLTGVGRYSEMTYIFDILMKVQQFELLFRKGIKDDKLKVALLDYLKRCCPEDKDTFTMVALKFSMHREIAELLEVEAKKFLQHIQHNYKNLDSSPDLQNSLQSVLQFYADAAESYVKVGCLRHAEKCVKKVRLLALQMHLLSTRTKVINLSQRDVNVFIAKHPRFPEALMVSEAYGKHTDWSTAIYNNVVVDGDFRYLEDFKAHLPLPSSLLSEVATRYKRDSSKSSATIANMKKLLSYFSDVELQYRLATEFGFNEIAMTLLQGEGGAFLKDVV